MSKDVRSFRLSDRTIALLEHYSQKWGESEPNVIVLALDRLHREESGKRRSSNRAKVLAEYEPEEDPAPA